MSQYIYGKNTIYLRLKTNKDVEEIYLTPNFKDEKILPLLKGKEVNFLSNKELTKLVKTDKHQGIIAKIKQYPFYSFEKLLQDLKEIEKPVLLMLDKIEDPRNLGAILRTCDAIGVNGVFIPKHGSVSLNATVGKTSTGAIESVKVVEVTNLTKTLQELKKIGFWVVGLDANQATDYREVDYNVPLVVVAGSEGKGISRLVLSECDFKVKLPMLGSVSSLNVSVATAILLYHIHAFKNL